MPIIARPHALRLAAGTAAVAMAFALTPATAIAEPPGKCRESRGSVPTKVETDTDETDYDNNDDSIDVAVAPDPDCGKKPSPAPRVKKPLRKALPPRPLPRKPLPRRMLPHTGMTAATGYTTGLALILTGVLAITATTRRRAG